MTPTLAQRASAQHLAAAILAFSPLVAAQASEVYVQLGLPGVGLGYAHPVSPSLTVRGDFTTLGTRSKNVTEEGLDYKARLKTDRGGLYLDWFPMQGGFRTSLGLTANAYKLNLEAVGNGSTQRVGSRDYLLGANDGLTVQVKFPSTTPYFGFGWGHQSAGTGWRFSADLGASFGKAKVTAVGRGQLATPTGQADVDQEVAEIRKGVGEIKVLPQISFAIGRSF